ncbi:dihydrofolate reductase [Streptomyces sp. NPDC021093]|uniref:dihydrofolate reductase n=1 Tax=Streptomyces sp. NPDC021093 TaxID=3365112 RepID=UPI0037AEBA83
MEPPSAAQPYGADHLQRAGSVAEALGLAAGSPESVAPAETWVIGGGEIYRAAPEHAVTLSVTEIDTTVGGDTYAPTVDAMWRAAEDEGWRSSTSGLRYRIRRCTR